MSHYSCKACGQRYSACECGGKGPFRAAPPPADAVTDAMQSAGEAAYDKMLRSTDDKSRVVRAVITAALAAREPT